MRQSSSTLVPLTQGKFALIDTEDFDLVKNYKWYLHCGRYACTGDKTVSMHRLLLGVQAEGHKNHIDHINGDGLDNRRSNLRLCSPAQNQHNARRRKDNKTGVKGVSRSKYGFRAYLFYEGRQVYLGAAKTVEDAARLYETGAKRYYGEFANNG